MGKKEKNNLLGANRGPFLTDEGVAPGADLEKTNSAGGMSLIEKPTFKEKLRRHWKRYWFLLQVGNIIFLAWFLPVVFLVILPAVAQLVVNLSDLWLTEAIVNSPLPDSVIMTVKTKVDLHLALPVWIMPLVFKLFNRLPGFGTEYPYAHLPVTGQTITGNYTLGVENVYTPILNLTSFTEFVREIVFQEKTTFSLYGQANAYIGVLKSHVIMNKDIVAPSLNQFKGFTIEDTTLILPLPADGKNLKANVTLPNPTVLSFEVGTLNLNALSGDLVIGSASMENVNLHPGDNTYPLVGSLDLAKVLANLGPILTQQASSLKNGNLSLNAVTTSVVWNGTLVPYYTDVLKTLTLTAQVPIAQILKNTIRHFFLHSGLNITKIQQNMGLNGSGGGGKRSLDSGEGSETNALAAVFKHNAYVQDLFKGYDEEQRDQMIDTLMSYYSEED